MPKETWAAADELTGDKRDRLRLKETRTDRGKELKENKQRDEAAERGLT